MKSPARVVNGICQNCMIETFCDWAILNSRDQSGATYKPYSIVPQIDLAAPVLLDFGHNYQRESVSMCVRKEIAGPSEARTHQVWLGDRHRAGGVHASRRPAFRPRQTLR